MNLFERGDVLMSRYNRATVEFCRSAFYEFCLHVWCGDERIEISDAVKDLAEKIRQTFTESYGDDYFKYRVHAAYWLRSVIREEAIVKEIRREMDRRAFLKSLSLEFKLAWMIRCETENWPPNYKRRVSPVVKAFDKHTDWIQRIVGDRSTVSLLTKPCGD